MGGSQGIETEIGTAIPDSAFYKSAIFVTARMFAAAARRRRRRIRRFRITAAPGREPVRRIFHQEAEQGVHQRQ